MPTDVQRRACPNPGRGKRRDRTQIAIIESTRPMTSAGCPQKRRTKGGGFNSFLPPALAANFVPSTGMGFCSGIDLGDEPPYSESKFLECHGPEEIMTLMTWTTLYPAMMDVCIGNIFECRGKDWQPSGDPRDTEECCCDLALVICSGPTNSCANWGPTGVMGLCGSNNSKTCCPIDVPCYFLFPGCSTDCSVVEPSEGHLRRIEHRPVCCTTTSTWTTMWTTSTTSLDCDPSFQQV